MPQTDWTQYYRRPAITARFARRIAAGHFDRVFSTLLENMPARPLKIVEFGAGNSHLPERLAKLCDIREYLGIDNNSTGLTLFQKNAEHLRIEKVSAEQSSVLDPHTHTKADADIVFSIGLIEHFTENEFHDAVCAHFRRVRPGGYVLFQYPSPTLLYRATRFTAECLHCWQFPDEHPLFYRALLPIADEFHANLLHTEIIRSMILTQSLTAFQA